MWYASLMPHELPKDALEGADAAIAFAQQVRRYHRRRTATDSKQRATDIELAIERLHEAMRPIKSEIGKFPYGPQTVLAECNRDRIRDASREIQRERRKLWKMKNPVRKDTA